MSARVSKSLHVGVGAASWGSEEEAPVQLEGLAKAALGRDPGVRRQGPPQRSASRGTTLLCGRISQLEASAQNQGLQEQPEAPRARQISPAWRSIQRLAPLQTQLTPLGTWGRARLLRPLPCTHKALPRNSLKARAGPHSPSLLLLYLFAKVRKSVHQIS